MDKKQILKYTKEELQLMGFEENHKLISSMLDFISTSFDLSNGDTKFFKELLNMPVRSAEGFPLSPIHLNEFERDQHGIRRNVRYEHAWQDPIGGKYFDSKGLGYIDKNDDFHVKYGTNGSLQSNVEITTFPYYPKRNLVKEK